MRTEIWIALPAIGMIAAALTRLTCGCTHLPSVGSLIPTNAVGTVTTTTTTTTTTQPPAASDDAVAMSALTWNRGGIDHSRAARDTRVTLTSARISANTLTYAGTGLSTWPLRSFNPGGNINAVWSIFFDGDRDGRYERGGKFDWGRFTAAPRPLHHLDHAYSNWDGYPSSGTPWAAVITDEHGKHRSNIVGGIWP